MVWLSKCASIHCGNVADQRFHSSRVSGDRESADCGSGFPFRRKQAPPEWHLCLLMPTRFGLPPVFLLRRMQPAAHIVANNLFDKSKLVKQI
jgi:hypothetical protein